MVPMIQDMQAGIQRLKVEVSTPRASLKDVSLVAGIKAWTGDSKGRTVHEFFAQTDAYAKVRNWSEEEKTLIAKAKLQGIALKHVQGRQLLSNYACPYVVLRERLTERFSEKLPAQYHYTTLQDAMQEKGESVEQFADRSRR
jgi:hypothetical protein